MALGLSVCLTGGLNAPQFTVSHAPVLSRISKSVHDRVGWDYSGPCELTIDVAIVCLHNILWTF